ncbi:MAG: translation initiation factor IF-2 [Firmicutes bacterium]|nr:translation initiation factor IF-2 [Bacillota bacterium]
MEKVRIYELAKELNTTSKRLIEKLAEININVKNHMSYLDEQEIEALYKHIGVVSYEQENRDEDKKKTSAFAPQTKMDQKKPEAKDSKSAPRIIRTTEIVVDEKINDRYKESGIRKDENHHGRNKGEFKGGRRYGGIKVNIAGSGLRAGFVRDTGPVIKKKDKPAKIDKAQDKAQDKIQDKIQDKDQDKIQDETEKKVQDKIQDKIEDKSINKNIKEINIINHINDEKETKESVQEPVKDDTKIKGQIKEAQKELKDGKEKHKDQQEKSGFKGEKSKVVAGEEMKTMGKDKKSREKYEANFDKSEDDKLKSSVQDQIKKDGNKNNKNKGQGTGYTSPKTYKQEGKKPQFLEIPEPDIDIEYEEIKHFDYRNKDFDKDKKREQKRELPKIQTSVSRKKKFKTHEIIVDGKRNISELITEDILIDEFYDDHKTKKAIKPIKRKTEDKNKDKKNNINVSVTAPKPVLKMVEIPEKITVKDLAEILKKSAADVIKKLISMGIMVTVNQEIDYDTAAIIADEFGIKAEKEVVVNEEDILFDDEEDNEEDLRPRPPVVVVMGHVDHGKTSLLDAIRKTNVIESEEGGITQHIGAYTVNINNRNITFLDTPGHEAFTALRARGAQVTDIAILVVAADDGIMPQTIEAINHAKAANVTIIVAINKIDKPGANPERVKQQLTEHGLVPEEWGGDVVVVPVSALKRENIDLLLEMVLLTADLLELKANPKKQAKGTIIESKLDKNRGPVVTLLVQRGTLNVGDTIISGTILSRIRAMNDDKGQSIKYAGPSTPVEVLGFPEVPESGEIFYAIKDEKLAKSLIEKRKEKYREEQMKKSASKVSLDDLFSQIQEGKVKELNMIIKADVQGSVEALKQSIEKLSNDEVKINIIHDGVGGITETDVKLADVSNAIIIGFNVRPGPNVSEIAKNSNVDIRLYRIIYDVIEDIQAAMKGMLEPKLEEVIQGHAEVRQLFKASGIGTIGGSYVLDGKITRNSGIRVLRDGIVVYEGKLASLKRFKDDVREVSQGYECGILIDKFNDIKEGDIIEAYIMEEVQE